MSTSKLQRHVSDQLSIHFGGYTIRENIRPDWLLGKGGERLELDFYLEELDIAIEVQGQQHYVYSPHFHASYDDYKRQVERDEAKRQTCVKMGIALYEIDKEDQVVEILQQIKGTVSNTDLSDIPSEAYAKAALHLHQGAIDRIARITQMLKDFTARRRHKKETTALARRHYKRIREYLKHYSPHIFEILPTSLIEDMVGATLAYDEYRVRLRRPRSRDGYKRIRRKTAWRRAGIQPRIWQATRYLEIGQLDLFTFVVWGKGSEYVLRITDRSIRCSCQPPRCAECSHVAKHRLVYMEGKGQACMPPEVVLENKAFEDFDPVEEITDDKLRELYQELAYYRRYFALLPEYRGDPTFTALMAECEAEIAALTC